MRHLTLPLALLAFAGCEQATSDVGVGTPGDLLVQSYLAPEDRPTTPEQRMALSEASRDALKSTAAVLRTSASWTEADRRMRALISEETDPIRKRRLEETAATRMLRADVLGADDSPGALDATGDYVEMLVRHGSPDAPLIADALERLDEGGWSSDRVARLAEGAAAALEAYARRGETCEACGTARVSAPTPAAASRSQGVYQARFSDSERRIYALAGRE